MPTITFQQLAITAAKTLAALSLAAGFASLLFNWFFWAKFHIDTPIDDTLRLLPFIQASLDNGWGGVPLAEWVSPHASAHRIAVGRLLMATEYQYLWGENRLFYLGSWISVGVLCYLYFKASRASKESATNTSLFMLGMALIYTCSYTQTLNLIVPINSLWFISAACCAGSVYLMVFDRVVSLPRAVASCTLAIIAAYSVFTGVIACLVVIIIAIQSRSRHALWITPLMLVFVTLYLQDVKSGQELVLEKMTKGDVEVTFAMHFQALINNSGKWFSYTVAFLSSPLPKSELLLSYAYVIHSFLLILYGWARLTHEWVTGKVQVEQAAIFYLAMATVFLGTAMACYLGRGFFDRPTDPRYLTTVMLYWLSIAGLILCTMPGRNDPRIKVVYLSLILLMPFGMSFTKSEFNLVSAIHKSNLAADVKTSMAMGSPNFKDDNFTARKYAPDYVKFESFISKYSNTNVESRHLLFEGVETLNNCASMRLRFQRVSANPGEKNVVSLKLGDKWFQRFRGLDIVSPDGGSGYLRVDPKGTLSLAQLVWDDTDWKGFYSGDVDSPYFILIFDSVLGPDYHCRLDTVSRSSQEKTTIKSGQKQTTH